MVGELIGQARKYASLGIDKIHFVTNHPEDSAEKVRASLQGAVSKENLKLTSFEVVGGSIESLLKWLDQSASNIAQIFVKALERKLREPLPKGAD